MKPRTFLALVVLSLTITVSAQAPNPLYLREMPKEVKVVREIQGTDPIDTIARQAGGQTFFASHYAIRGTDSQWLINLDNGGNPVSLALGPGRSISGSGPIRVTGHAFVGNRNNGNGPMFAPATTTCASGTLNPAR